MHEKLIYNVKRLLKHSTIYGLGTLLYRAVALVLLPLYTRYLDTGGYGDLELFFITSTFLVMILQFGMGSAIFRAIIYKKDNDPKLILSTAFIFLILIDSIFVLGLCYFARELSIAIFETPERANLLRLLFISDLFLVLAILPQAKLRIDERSSLFTIVAVGNFIVGVTLTAIFLVVFKWGVDGVIWAQLINSIIFTIVYLSVIFKDLRPLFSFYELKDMLGYGLPLLPASVATSVLLVSNRYFLRHLGTAEDVGFFSAGYRISQVIALIINAFQMAWPTLLFSIVKEENARETFSKLLTYFVFILVGISFVFSVFAREILLIVAKPEYLAAEPIIPILLQTNMAWGFFYMTSVGINVKKKTIYIAIITGVAAIVNLFLNYWLIAIPGFRLMGAALAGFGGNIIVAVATLAISLRFYYVKYEYGKIFHIFSLAATIYFISRLIPDWHWSLVVSCKSALIILFAVLIYKTHFFTESEITKAKNFLKLLREQPKNMFAENKGAR